MHIDWQLLFTALGLALVIEGLPYFLFAEKMPSLLKLLAEQPPKALRILGCMAMFAGLFIVFVVKS